DRRTLGPRQQGRQHAGRRGAQARQPRRAVRPRRRLRGHGGAGRHHRGETDRQAFQETSGLTRNIATRQRYSDPQRALVLLVIPESRSDIRTAKAGCRSEHSHSEWPGGQAAGCGAFASVFAFQSVAQRAARFRPAPERRNVCWSEILLLDRHWRTIVVTHAIDQLVERIDAGFVWPAVHRYGDGAVAVLDRHFREVQWFLVLLLAILRLREHADLDRNVDFRARLLALAVGVVLRRVHVQRHFVLAIREFFRRRGNHAVVEQGDLVEEVGDQVLVLRPGLRAQVGDQFARVGVRRLLELHLVEPRVERGIHLVLAYVIGQRVEDHRGLAIVDVRLVFDQRQRLLGDILGAAPRQVAIQFVLQELAHPGWAVQVF